MTDFPGLEILDYHSLPDASWQSDQISTERNAFGVAPPKIMYLWLFDRQDSLCGQLVSHGWVFIGPIHLLISPAARVDSPLLKSAKVIDRAVAGFQYAAGKYKCPKLLDYEHRPTYTGYPINCLWCSNRSWIHGFEVMAKRSDRFVADLSADEQPEGLITELGFLFQHVPLRQVVFLLDTRTADMDTVKDFLAQAWTSMPGDAINVRHDGPIPIITYDTLKPSYLLQATLSLWSGKSKIPLAGRAARHMNW